MAADLPFMLRIFNICQQLDMALHMFTLALRYLCATPGTPWYPGAMTYIVQGLGGEL